MSYMCCTFVKHHIRFVFINLLGIRDDDGDSDSDSNFDFHSKDVVKRGEETEKEEHIYEKVLYLIL